MGIGMNKGNNVHEDRGVFSLLGVDIGQNLDF